MKKTANTKKNLEDKQAKDQKNAQNKSKAWALDLIRLVTPNKSVKKIETFENILFNLVNNNKILDNIILTLILFAILFLKNLQQINSVRQTNHQIKKFII